MRIGGGFGGPKRLRNAGASDRYKSLRRSEQGRGDMRSREHRFDARNRAGTRRHIAQGFLKLRCRDGAYGRGKRSPLERTHATTEKDQVRKGRTVLREWILAAELDKSRSDKNRNKVKFNWALHALS